MNIKKIISKIPGFRTEKSNLKKCIIIFSYIFMILIIIGSLNGYTFIDKIIGLLQGLSLILPIYILVANVKNIRSKLPLLKNKSRIEKCLGVFVYSVLTLIFFSTVYGVSFEYLSAEQKQINIADSISSCADKSNLNSSVEIYNEKQNLNSKELTSSQTKTETETANTNNTGEDTTKNNTGTNSISSSNTSKVQVVAPESTTKQISTTSTAVSEDNTTSTNSNKTTVSTQTSSPKTNNVNNSKTVYYTPNGKSYHYSKGCRTLARSKTILSQTLSEALNSDHSDPCDVCVK